MRRPVIRAEGQHAAPGTWAVDAPVPGAAAIYSHWQDGGATPTDLLADTSTGMLVRAAEDEARWLTPYRLVANTHVDADGLLALACACRPDLARRHGPLLIAAAEAGDFTEWTGEAGFRLLMVLHQMMRDGPGGTALAEQVVDQFEELIIRSQDPEAERDAAVALVVEAIARLQRQDGITILRQDGWWSLAWERRLGHASDVFGQIPSVDDLPLWAMEAVVPRGAFLLTSEKIPSGWRHVFEAPRYSWARTVVRPPVAWPDLRPVAEALTQREPTAGWCAGPEAGRVAFTGLLACVSSALTPDDLAPYLKPQPPR